MSDEWKVLLVETRTCEEDGNILLGIFPRLVGL